MSSKRRLRRRQCGRKIRYATAALAELARHELRQSRGLTQTVNVYGCAFCRGYHLGRKPGAAPRAPRMLRDAS